MWVASESLLVPEYLSQGADSDMAVGKHRPEVESEPMEQELEPEDDSRAESMDAEFEPNSMDSKSESFDDSSESSRSDPDWLP